MFDVVAVMPVLVGPLQVLLALLPAILAALGGMVFALFKPSGFKRLLRFLWHQKLFTVGVACLAAALWLGYPQKLWSRGSTAGGEVSAEARAGVWPMFRGGPDRDGWSAAGDDPTVPASVWTWSQHRTVYSSPTVAGDRVYFTTVSGIGPFTPAGQGAVVCVDAFTGRELWRYAPDDFRGTFSSPAVAEERIVVGEGLHLTDDARVTCLDLAGRLVWSHRTQSHVESTPCIHSGRVFVAAAGDGVYAFALAPKENGEPEILWHIGGENYKDCESSPVTDGETVWFGLGDEGNAVVAVDAATGKEKWRASTPAAVFGPPTLAGGKIYVGMGNGNFAFSAEEVLATKLEALREEGRPQAEIEAAAKSFALGGAVWRIDATTGGVEWKLQLDKTVLDAIAHRDGRLWFGSLDGKVRCVSTDGEPVAEWDAGSPILSSPAVARSHVYVASKGGRLSCLRKDTLQLVWEMPVQLSGPPWNASSLQLSSSPAVAHGRVYVGTEDQGMRSVGTTEPPAPPLWTNGDSGGFVGDARIPEEVETAWKFPPEKPSETYRGPKRFVVVDPLVMLGESLYAVGAEPPAELADGLTFEEFERRNQTAWPMRMVRLDTRDEVAESDRLKWVVDLPGTGSYTAAPAGVGDRIVVQTSPGGGDDPHAHLVAVDAAAGKIAWEKPLELVGNSGFAIDRRRTYAWTKAVELTAFDLATGGPVWRRLTTREGEIVYSYPAGPPLVAGDMVLYAAIKRLADAGPSTITMTALDAPTGALLWSAAIESEWTPVRPVVVGRSIVMATRNGLAARSLVDGTKIWESAIGRPVRRSALWGDRLVVMVESGDAVGVSAADGSELARHKPEPGAQRPFSVAPAFDGSSALIWTRTGWFRWNLEFDTFDEWFAGPVGDRGFVGPLVFAGGRAYDGVTVDWTRGGVVCLKKKAP